MGPIGTALASIGAALGTSASTIGTVLAIGGTIASVGASNKAAAAQRRAIGLQQRAQHLQVQKSRRAAIRESQLMRAQQLSMGVAAGAQAGSGVAGGGASIFSNLGAGLGFSTAGSGIARDISAANQSMTTYNSQASMWGAVAGFGTNVLGGGLSFGADKQAPSTEALLGRE